MLPPRLISLRVRPQLRTGRGNVTRAEHEVTVLGSREQRPRCFGSCEKSASISMTNSARCERVLEAGDVSRPRPSFSVRCRTSTTSSSSASWSASRPVPSESCHRRPGAGTRPVRACSSHRWRGRSADVLASLYVGMISQMRAPIAASVIGKRIAAQRTTALLVAINAYAGLPAAVCRISGGRARINGGRRRPPQSLGASSIGSPPRSAGCRRRRAVVIEEDVELAFLDALVEPRAAEDQRRNQCTSERSEVPTSSASTRSRAPRAPTRDR